MPGRTPTPRQLDEQRRRVWKRTRRTLEAADTPADQETDLARQARQQVRLSRHDWKDGVYRSQGYPGLVLRRRDDDKWEWLSSDWNDRGLAEAVGPYPTQRAALAAWAVAMRKDRA